MVTVRFECPQEDRVSPVYGPFEFVQMTYDTLRVGPDGEDFANYDHASGEWYVAEDERDEARSLVHLWYSDVIIASL